MIATPRRSAVNTNDMLGLLMRDLDRYPMPNYDEQVELAKRVTAGDEEAKKQMVAANLRLVLHWARRYQDRGVEMVDLVQELSLIHISEPTRQAEISYAVFCLKKK